MRATVRIPVGIPIVEVVVVLVRLVPSLVGVEVEKHRAREARLGAAVDSPHLHGVASHAGQRLARAHGNLRGDRAAVRVAPVRHVLVRVLDVRHGLAVELFHHRPVHRVAEDEEFAAELVAHVAVLLRHTPRDVDTLHLGEQLTTGVLEQVALDAPEHGPGAVAQFHRAPPSEVALGPSTRGLRVFDVGEPSLGG